jgi:hemoglobin
MTYQVQWAVVASVGLFFGAVASGASILAQQCLQPPVQVVQARTAASTPARPVAKKPLYERLGGQKAITAVVDDFVARAAGNPKVNFTRKGTNMEWQPSEENIRVLKKHLVQLVSMVTGGPQKYEGRDMKTVHRGMMISDEEFDALAGDLIATLKKFKVPKPEQDELVKIVASTRKDIVERPSQQK